MSRIYAMESRMRSPSPLGALVLLAAGILAPGASAAELPSRGRCRQAARSAPWGKGQKQIPSTVIDAGVLRDIPYLSYRAGSYEVNVYGDPAAPACFEIGIHKELLHRVHVRQPVSQREGEMPGLRQGSQARPDEVRPPVTRRAPAGPARG